MTINLSTLLGADVILGYTGSKGALSDWSVKTANYTAVNNDRIIADTSSGQFTITLPATPAAGTYVQITDGGNFVSNNLLVSRNGSTIENLSDDVLLNVGDATYEFLYANSTWQITATAGPIGYTGSASTVIGFTGSLGFTGSVGYTGSISGETLIATPSGTSVNDTVVALDSFDTSTYRTAKYIISVDKGTEFQSAEALLVHDGNVAQLVTYAIVYTGAARIVNFSANVVSNTVTLYGQGITANNVVKLQKIYITT